MTGRRSLAITAAAITLVAAFLAFVLATAPGTRLAFAAAAPFLPGELSVDGLEGSLVTGFGAAHVAWGDGADDLAATGLRGSVRLAPLLIGRLSFDLEAVSVLADFAAGSDGAAIQTDWMTPIDATLRVTEFRLRTAGAVRMLGTLRVTASVHGGELRIARLRLDTPRGQVDVRGRLGLASPHRAALDATWRWHDSLGDDLTGTLAVSGDLSSYRLRHVMPKPTRVVTDGHLGFDGEMWSFELSSSSEALAVSVAGGPILAPAGRLDVIGTMDGASLGLAVSARLAGSPIKGVRSGEQIILGAEPGVEVLTAAANITRAGRWSGHAHLRGLHVATSDLPIMATLGATAEFEADWTGDSGPQVRIAVDRIHGVVNGQPVSGSGSLSARGATVGEGRALLSVGGNSVEAEGSLAGEVDLTVRLNAPHLERLLTGASGGLTATVMLVGSKSDPRLVVEAIGQRLHWDGVDADRAEAMVDGSLGDHRIDVAAEGPGWSVAVGARNRRRESGWLLDIDALRFGGRRTGWSLTRPATLSVAPGYVSVRDLCLSEEVRGLICGTVSGRSLQDGALTVSASDIPLNWLDQYGIALSGTMSADGRFRSRGGRVDGDLVARLDPKAVLGAAPLRAGVERGVVRVVVADSVLDATASLDTDIARAELRAALADVLDTTSSLNAQVQVEVDDLGVVAAAFPALHEPRGRILGELRITGTPDVPVFDGVLRLTGGQAGIPDAGIAVEDVLVEAVPAAPGRLALSGSLRSGEGEAMVDGEADFAGRALDAWFEVSGTDFELVDLPGLYLVASPDVRVTLGEGVGVTGTLRIPRADIEVGRDLPLADQTSPDAVVHGLNGSAAPPPRPYRIDIAAELGDDVRLDGAGLAARLEGAVRVSAGADGPWLGTGRLAIREGRRLGQELVVDRGELTFNGPLDEPAVDVRASRRVGEVAVGIALTGTPSRLQAALSSNPEMDDADVLSYLLTGRALDRASDAHAAGLAAAAFELGLARAAPVAAQLRDALGVDRLHIDGDAGTLIAGSRLGGRLWVEYAYGLVDRLGAPSWCACS